MLNVPLCPHRDVTPSRTISTTDNAGKVRGITRLMRCDRCGAEFARVPEPDPPSTGWRDRQQQRRLSRARERMFKGDGL